MKNGVIYSFSVPLIGNVNYQENNGTALRPLKLIARRGRCALNTRGWTKTYTLIGNLSGFCLLGLGGMAYLAYFFVCSIMPVSREVMKIVV